MKKTKKREIGRLVIGLHLFTGPAHSAACRAIYRVDFSDGSTETVSGLSVMSLTHPQRKDDPHARPDLYAVLEAALPLAKELENACVKADGVHIK
jgi:hypothetical protein